MWEKRIIKFFVILIPLIINLLPDERFVSTKYLWYENTYILDMIETIEVLLYGTEKYNHRYED